MTQRQRSTLSYLDELISVAEEEGLTEESQCHKVDTYGVFFDPDVFEGAKEKLTLFGGAAEREGWLGYNRGADGNVACGRGAPQDLLFIPSTPYLSIHDNIDHTPCEDIHAKCIVHATNGIVPVRGHITAQRAGTGLDDGWLGTGSCVLYPSASEDRWDYLTGTPSFFDAVGYADDSQVEFRFSAYFGVALAAYFGKWWGDESADEALEEGVVWRFGHLCGWTVVGWQRSFKGIGREWIAAGYSGEGMVHAWMGGKVLAYMVLGKDVDWLPAPFRVTEKRWRKANIVSLL